MSLIDNDSHVMYRMLIGRTKLRKSPCVSDAMSVRKMDLFVHQKKHITYWSKYEL